MIYSQSNQGDNSLFEDQIHSLDNKGTLVDIVYAFDVDSGILSSSIQDHSKVNVILVGIHLAIAAHELELRTQLFPHNGMIGQILLSL